MRYMSNWSFQKEEYGWSNSPYTRSKESEKKKAEMKKMINSEKCLRFNDDDFDDIIVKPKNKKKAGKR